MNQIQQIAIELLDDHPDNPRLIIRQDVVDGIAAQIEANGTFDPAHALMVRPVSNRFQIIWGHHRKLAAAKAGLTEVPCWVREMTNYEAYLQLGFGNAQGEWKPIEIGRHALGLPDRGLREYARQMGQKPQNISTYRQGADVLAGILDIKCNTDITLYVNKALHLAAIHKAPEELWPMLAEWVIIENDKGKTPTVNQTQALCKKVCKYSIPRLWQHIFLPPGDVVDAYIAMKSPDPSQVGQLINLADVIKRDILIYRRKLDWDRFSYTVRGFYDWLAAGQGAYSWELDELRGYYRQVKETAEEAECSVAVIAHEANETWLPRQEQCDLLLTDPPFMTDIEGDIADFAAEWLPRALAKVKSTGRAYVFVGAYPEELRAYLSIEDLHGMELANILVWTYRNTLGPTPKYDYKLNWQAILYFRGPDVEPLGCPIMLEQFTVHDINAPDARTGTRYHKWEKPIQLAERLVMHSTKIGDLVLDPYAGTGTFLLAARKLDRTANGCDTDEKMIEIAVSRGCIRE